MYATNYMLLLRVSSPQPAQPLPASVHHPLTLTLSGRGGAATSNASPTLCPSFCIFPPSDVVGGASLLSRDLINPALSLSLPLLLTVAGQPEMLSLFCSALLRVLLPLSGPLFCVGPSELQLPSSALPSGRPLLSLSFQPLPASTKKSRVTSFQLTSNKGNFVP